MTVKLSPRLAAAASFARWGKTIADIGTDHALIPCYLRQKGFESIIASDVNSGPLEAARSTIKEYGLSGITLVRSDGLRGIDKADDVIIAGMGGELIARITKECAFLSEDIRFILQPMTKADFLRRELYASGFEILEEKAAAEGARVYTILYVRYTGVKSTITDELAFIGKQEDPDYIRSQVKRLRRMGRGNGKYTDIADKIAFSAGIIPGVTAGEVYDIIDKAAPFSRQDKFDNSGLLVGSRDSVTAKICVAIDCTNEVIEEAASRGAALIVTHHPVIFNPLKSVEKGTPVYKLVSRGISVICAHTNFDMADYGLSSIMVQLLRAGDLKDTTVLEVINADGSGYGKVLDLQFYADAKSLAEMCKTAFGCTVVRYVDNNRPIKRLAVCSGTGNSVVHVAIEKGCDCLIAGDFKWEYLVEAKNAGLALIDAGHFHTENTICLEMIRLLSAAFPQIEVFAADKSRDLAEYVM